ncbi:ribokinase-like, partial [Paramacrobiotus metropolitanus]|uniref:ribokinase-like n=1 Tax=Paramacrobiotus metropolitanus TaxID=2943436 RepID=UPI0024464062
MAEIVVVGSLMIDLVSVTERIPKPGETIHGKSFAQNFGGKGANQCVAAQRLGAHTAMIGNVGDDDFGHQYKTEFENSGANTDYLRQISNCRTGIASIWVEASGQNSIIITANANEKLTAKNVAEAAKVIKAAKMVICQLEVSQEASLEALKLAKADGVRSIFNPAPATSELNAAFWNVLDIICPNETEAELLCGFPVDSEESYQKAIDFLLGKGAQTVILTLGEKGAVFASKDSQKITHVTTSKVHVADST